MGSVQLQKLQETLWFLGNVVAFIQLVEVQSSLMACMFLTIWYVNWPYLPLKDLCLYFNIDIGKRRPLREDLCLYFNIEIGKNRPSSKGFGPWVARH